MNNLTKCLLALTLLLIAPTSCALERYDPQDHQQFWQSWGSSNFWFVIIYVGLIIADTNKKDRY